MAQESVVHHKKLVTESCSKPNKFSVMHYCIKRRMDFILERWENCIRHLLLMAFLQMFVCATISTFSCVHFKLSVYYTCIYFLRKQLVCRRISRNMFWRRDMTAHGMLHTDLLLILIYPVTLVLNSLDISALLHKNAGIF